MFVIFDVTEPPGMPRNLRVLERSAHSIVLTCDVTRAADKLPVLTWRVEIFPDNEPENKSTLDFDGSGTSTCKIKCVTVPFPLFTTMFTTSLAAL